MDSGNRKVQYLVTLAVSLAAITTGVCFTWTTAIIPKFHNNETDIEMTDAGISWIAAMFSPGFVVGSLASRYISDKFGRRATLLSSAIPVAVGSLAAVFIRNIWGFCTARILWGVGNGMVGTVSSIYLAEIADKDNRGTLTVANRFFSLGIFLSLVIGPFVSFDTINYMTLALPVCYFASCWLIPETPYYYLKEGKVENARIVLTKLKGLKDEKILEDELSRMHADVNKEMRRSGSIKELFTGKQYRKAILVVTGLKVGQLATGNIVIQQYLGRIIQDSYLDMDLATVFIVFGAVRLVVGIVSSVIADKVGRRPQLIYTYFGSGLSLAVVAAYFCSQEIIKIEQSRLSPYAIVVFVGIIVFSIISSLGVNSIIYTIQGEVFPLNVKLLAVTCLNIFGGIFNFSITKSYQSLKDATGMFGVFTFFTIVSFVSIVFVYFIVPETKGKSLSEIQAILQGKYYDDDVTKINKIVSKDVTDATELKLLENKI
ncbi:LOW QUALITY PROTEIN: facilitated trehalose transporter Tret1-like [Aphomia sociella]